MLSPMRGGFAPPQDSLLRRTGSEPATTSNATPAAARHRYPAPSRIGNIPIYGVPAASGASDVRLRFAQPHAQEAETLSRQAEAESRRSRQPRRRPTPTAASAVGAAVGDRQQDAAPAGDRRHGSRPAHAPPAQARRRSVRRGRRLRRQVSDQGRGRSLGRLRHQSRPHLRAEGLGVLHGRAGILVASDWERHADRRSARLVHRLRQHLSAADRRHRLSAPTNVDRPNFNGKVDGRLDVSRDTRITAELRMRVFTDNPGSPNIQAGLAKYPI